MKIVLTGGGTGGHFYPLIAVAEGIRSIVKKENLVDPQLFYLSSSEFDAKALYENDIRFIKTMSANQSIGKGDGFKNFINKIKIFLGAIKAFFILTRIYPDVIFSKGGYASVPTLLAGRLLKIPIIIHDSDSVPGRVTLWSAKFARKIALSYAEAEKFFPKSYAEKIAVTGNLVRGFIFSGEIENAKSRLDLDENITTILFLGGSKGAKHLNEFLIELLPDLLENYQIIHQTGKAWYRDVLEYSTSILKNNLNKKRYRPLPYLDEYYLRLAFSASDVVVSRGGSGALSEIAAFSRPSLIIPLKETISRDQKTNAYSFARTTDAIVIEEENLRSTLFISQLEKLANDKTLRESISKKTKLFSRPAAKNKLARVILDISLEHE